jgi:hypothetical protein
VIRFHGARPPTKLPRNESPVAKALALPRPARVWGLFRALRVTPRSRRGLGRACGRACRLGPRTRGRSDPLGPAGLPKRFEGHGVWKVAPDYLVLLVHHAGFNLSAVALPNHSRRWPPDQGRVGFRKGGRTKHCLDVRPRVSAAPPDPGRQGGTREGQAGTNDRAGRCQHQGHSGSPVRHPDCVLATMMPATSTKEARRGSLAAGRLGPTPRWQSRRATQAHTRPTSVSVNAVPPAPAVLFLATD